MIYSGLTEFDGDMVPQLALAESIETHDRIHWRIRLRKGVEFHDGKTLKADDVVYSLLRHKVPALGSKVKAVSDQIAKAKALGPLELEVRLTGPTRTCPQFSPCRTF